MLLHTQYVLKTCWIVPQSGVNNFHYPNDSEKFGLLNGMALAVIMHLQLSYNVCIKKLSAKFIFFSAGLSAYLLFALYDSELTAGRNSWSKEFQ